MRRDGLFVGVGGNWRCPRAAGCVGQEGNESVLLQYNFVQVGKRRGEAFECHLPIGSQFDATGLALEQGAIELPLHFGDS